MNFLASICFVFTALSIVNGQSSTPPGTSTDPYGYAKFSPSMAIIIAVLITALFFMGFFSIYVRRWSQSGSGASVRATLSMRARRAAAARGLDATAIDALPTLAYAEVKDLHIGKGALECAVCLNEFEDDETLRLLPKCDHVFHLECIDMWLASHTTCPVCRADLAAEPVESVAVADDELPVSGLVNEADNVVEPQEVRVTIQPDQSQEKPTNNLLELPKPDGVKRTGSLRVNRPPRSGSVRSGSVRSKLFENIFPRSHSTGHSLVQPSVVQPGENVDRYTLRLPEELRNEIIKRSLNRTGSIVGEGSVKKGSKTSTNEEGSSRGKTFKRLGSLERVGKSDRWNFARMPSFLTRALSTRSKVVADGEPSTSAQPGGNDGSVKGKSTDPAKLPV